MIPFYVQTREKNKTEFFDIHGGIYGLKTDQWSDGQTVWDLSILATMGWAELMTFRTSYGDTREHVDHFLQHVAEVIAGANVNAES